MRGAASSNLVSGQVGRRVTPCAPDGLVAVFTNKQATVFRDGDSDGL